MGLAGKKLGPRLLVTQKKKVFLTPKKSVIKVGTLKKVKGLAVLSDQQKLDLKRQAAESTELPEFTPLRRVASPPSRAKKAKAAPAHHHKSIAATPTTPGASHHMNKSRQRVAAARLNARDEVLRKKAEADAKLKAEADAKLKAEAVAKLKAEAVAKLKAEATKSRAVPPSPEGATTVIEAKREVAATPASLSQRKKKILIGTTPPKQEGRASGRFSAVASRRISSGSSGTTTIKRGEGVGEEEKEERASRKSSPVVTTPIMIGAGVGLAVIVIGLAVVFSSGPSGGKRSVQKSPPVSAAPRPVQEDRQNKFDSDAGDVSEGQDRTFDSISEAPADADLYREVKTGKYVDVNKFHPSMRNRITKNTRNYKKVQR